MSKKRKSYSADFKQEAVRRMAQATAITALAKELGIRRELLYLWRHQLEAEGRAGLERRRGRKSGSKSRTASPPGPSATERRIAELERQLGRKQLELDLLKRAVEQGRGAAPGRTTDGGKESIAESKPHSKEQH